MVLEYTNVGLGYPVFDVVSPVSPTGTMRSDEENGQSKDEETEFKPLPMNAFVVVGGGGSSRSGIKNCICILYLEENDQGLVQSKVLLDHGTGNVAPTSSKTNLLHRI